MLPLGSSACASIARDVPRRRGANGGHRTAQPEVGSPFPPNLGPAGAARRRLGEGSSPPPILTLRWAGWISRAEGARPSRSDLALNQRYVHPAAELVGGVLQRADRLEAEALVELE